jgi:hypothetical protein
MEKLGPMAKDRTLEVLKAEVVNCLGQVPPWLKNSLIIRQLRLEDSVTHLF